MNRDELKAMLADYLGDELDAERKSEFETALADDPEFTAEVKGLQETLQTLRTLDEPTATPIVAPRADRLLKVPGLWRYAAVVAFAFVGGYLARSPAVQIATSPAKTITQESTGNSFSDPTSEWRLRLAKRYVEHPSDSSLARSLVALARSSE